MSTPEGPPPRAQLPAGARSRFTLAGTLPDDWEGLDVGDYTFAPGSETFCTPAGDLDGNDADDAY